ncbi:uracil-DNA glycosylase [Candidatus Dojkabacteria bacterium]|nr:uracil-DNA glycosylase [Candidatus Dojkabacteria bacterium]
MEKYKTLTKLHEDCLKCEKCPLRREAKQVVPGEGNPHADIMFIGEGPGANEDKLGRPFVGAAGKFLDELLASIELDRSEVFIANMVKCRPPKNRDPSDQEKKACRPWLDEQIRLIRPRVFVPLGRHALHKFVPDIRISKAHGRFFRAQEGDFRGKVVFAMYHPAAALYNGSMRPTLLSDMQNLKKFLVGINEGNIDLDKVDLDSNEFLAAGVKLEEKSGAKPRVKPEVGSGEKSKNNPDVSEKVKEVRQILAEKEKKSKLAEESDSQVSMFS